MEKKNKIFSSVDSLMSETWPIAKFLHENPELGHNEFKAQNKLVSFLSEKGFQCETKIGDLKTAFVARRGSAEKGKPTIGFIAEYDALPNLGHACGHNLIAASALTAAIALIDSAPELAGQVAVIGTPAEEVPPPTKQTMIDAGAFNEVDIALIMHGGDRTATGGKSLAIDSLEFEFKGKTSHASKYPHLGVSALDAAILTMNALEYLREHVRQDVRIHGVITNGGSRPNVVPDYASLEYYVRALDRGYLDEISERVFNCARAGALATGAEVKINILGKHDNKILLPTLDKILLDAAIEADAPNVMEAEKDLGSTDFGNVSHHIPASTLKLGFVPKGTPGHTPAWAEASNGPSAIKAVNVAGKAMALTAHKLLTDQNLYKKVKSEHQELT